MPTCDSKVKPTSLGSLTAAELDHHASEAAKVKRTKEQAYFNSYDFDAIEVLPYDDEDEGDRSHTLQHQHHHHHGSHSGHHPKYTVGGCKTCHQTSQSASVSPSPATLPTVSHSHSLSNRPHPHQQQQQQQLKKKKTKPSSSHSSSSHSSSTSSSLSSFSRPNSTVDSKRTYLKRIGAFFTSNSLGKRSSIESLTDIEKQTPPTNSSASSSQISLESNIRSMGKLYDGSSSTGGGSSKRDHVMDDALNSNFLLPRAMLKYQRSLINRLQQMRFFRTREDSIRRNAMPKPKYFPRTPQPCKDSRPNASTRE